MDNVKARHIPCPTLKDNKVQGKETKNQGKLL